MESSSMTEIRKIRDENSECHLKMSKNERLEELKKSVEWLVSATKQKDDDGKAS